MLRVSGWKGLGGSGRERGIAVVRRAQARTRRDGGLEGGGERFRRRKPRSIERLDAAGLEEALGKGRARCEVGRRAEVGKKDLWPRPGVLELGIRLIA